MFFFFSVAKLEHEICRKDSSSTSSTVLPAISEGSLGAGVMVVVVGGVVFVVVAVKLADVVVLFYHHNKKRKVSIKKILHQCC